MTEMTFAQLEEALEGLVLIEEDEVIIDKADLYGLLDGDIPKDRLSALADLLETTVFYEHGIWVGEDQIKMKIITVKALVEAWQ